MTTLLEMTHGQWLYTHVQVHNAVSWLKKVERTKELPWETEHQLLLGGTGLDEQDRYLSAIHVGDLEILAGADQ